MSKKVIQYELLKDKSVIVTGGASGLGLATATQFAGHGAYVTLADFNQETGEKAARVLTDQGLRVSFVKCDVTDWQSSVEAFKHAVNFSPQRTLDIAALFAGTSDSPDDIYDQVIKAHPEPNLSHEPKQPSTVTLDVNLTGLYFATALALHYFRLKPENAINGGGVEGRKSLILVSSLAGYIDYNGNSTYAMSKYGVRGLFRNLRKRIKDPSTGIRCNMIAPGYTITPMTQHMADQNFLWCPVDAVVDAAGLCAVDDTVHGRAFCTLPDGYHDLEEDWEKGYAGSRLTELMESSGYYAAGFC